MMSSEWQSCHACSRLADYLASIRTAHPDYHAAPVAAFGDAQPWLLIVGLAPGLHGANRTGRPFTGDHAGILLYQTLYDFGFASAPVSVAADDGLALRGCRITNAVKCVPPANKPERTEIRQCNAYLTHELSALPQNSSVLALGKIAHDAVLMALQLSLQLPLPLSTYRFAHAARHALPTGQILYDSYHCSRYNTQTGRLTAEMFAAVFARLTADHRADASVAGAQGVLADAG